MSNVQLAHYTVCQAVAICHVLQLVWEHLPPEALSSEFHHEAIIQPDLDATCFLLVIAGEDSSCVSV